MVGYRKEKVHYDYQTKVQIYNEYKNSTLSMREIAIKYNITERTVQRIKKLIERDNSRVNSWLSENGFTPSSNNSSNKINTTSTTTTTTQSPISYDARYNNNHMNDSNTTSFVNYNNTNEKQHNSKISKRTLDEFNNIANIITTQL